MLPSTETLYRCVLVPLDLGIDADRALPVGAAVAARFGVELDVVIVTSPKINPLEDEKEVALHARRLGVEVDRVLLAYDEDVADGLLAEGAASHGLICCATHARGPAADLVFHSVSGRVVRDTAEPLLLVGPRVPTDRRPGLTGLVVCVDGSLTLAETIAATTPWARALSAKVRVVEVRKAGEAGDYSTAERVAGRLAERGLDVTWTVLEGDPAEQIAEFAQKMHDPLLVVGTHGRQDHGSAPLGSVSRALVREVPHPVLVVPARD